MRRIVDDDDLLARLIFTRNGNDFVRRSEIFAALAFALDRLCGTCTKRWLIREDGKVNLPP